jgi:hypothetical protein
LPVRRIRISVAGSPEERVVSRATEEHIVAVVPIEIEVRTATFVAAITSSPSRPMMVIASLKSAESF